MPCVLRISGKQFAAREFADNTRMPVCKVYVRGEPRLPRSQPDGRKNKLSGVNITVSQADFTNLKRQIREALSFLGKYKPALGRVRRAAGVEQITLDFGVASRQVAAQFDYFPPELLLAAGELGIGLEIY